MEEESKETPKEKYIKCNMCHCKYNNDEESIKTYFGHNRLKERTTEREIKMLTCPTCNREFPRGNIYQHRRMYCLNCWAYMKHNILINLNKFNYIRNEIIE